jgi:DNA-binding protein
MTISCHGYQDLFPGYTIAGYLFLIGAIHGYPVCFPIFCSGDGDTSLSQTANFISIEDPHNKDQRRLPVMTELPVAPVMRIIRKHGGERVSRDAGEMLSELMEAYGAKITKEAIKLASHAGRKTVTIDDIRMAAEILS